MTKSNKTTTANNNGNNSPHWNTMIIPAIFLAASAVCYVEPTMSSSIFFALLGWMSLYIISTKTASSSTTTPFADIANGMVASTLDAFVSDENTARRERLICALSDVVSGTMRSSNVRDAVKSSIIDSLNDDSLRDSALITLETALVKSSENEGLRNAVLSVVRRAFAGALNDEAFVRDLMSSIVSALVQASKEEELTASLLDVVTRALTKALSDERLVMELRGAITSTLRDGEIYKAGARGMVSAFMRGGSSEGRRDGFEMKASSRKDS